MGPGGWLNVVSRDKAMAAAIQLHRDVCLMTTNLDILDQYALSLQGTASKMLVKCLGSSDFPSAGALGPRVRRASIQMEVMGLWRPSLDPILLAYGVGTQPVWTDMNLFFTVLDSDMTAYIALPVIVISGF